MALRAWMLLTMASMAYAPAPWDEWGPWGNPRYWPKGTPREPWADVPGRNPRYDKRGYKSDMKRKEKRAQLGVHERYLERQAEAEAAAHNAHVAQTQAALAGYAAGYAEAQAAANQAAVALMADGLADPALPAQTAAPTQADRDHAQRQAIAAEALSNRKRQPLSAAGGILAAKRVKDEMSNGTGRAASGNATLKRQASASPRRQGKQRTDLHAPETSSKSASTTQSKTAIKTPDRFKPEQLRRPPNLAQSARSRKAPRTPAKEARSGTPARARSPASLPMHERSGTKEAAAPAQTGQLQVAANNQNKIKKGVPT